MGVNSRAATRLWSWRGLLRFHSSETERQDRGFARPISGAVLWAFALGSFASAVHQSQSKKSTLPLLFQHQSKVFGTDEGHRGPAPCHSHPSMAGAHALLSSPVPSESHPEQSRFTVADKDIRHQMAQVYGPCVITEEKAAQGHNTGQAQHQDSPEGAKRFSRNCPQCGYYASATPALTQQLRPAPPILFAA